MTDVIFFGMTGRFSLAPLAGLLKANVNVKAVVVPGDPSSSRPLPRRVETGPSSASELQVVEPYPEDSIIQLAWRHDVPVWEVGSLSDSESLAMIARYEPDLIAVACFPCIFPAALLQLPRHGCLNLHPSLLPAYRGPAPLFWIARQDERMTGITLHYLDEGIDTGDIVGQVRFSRPEGMTEVELEQHCAVAGADLLLAAAEQLERGSLSRRPQPEAGASYFPWPVERDFVIPTGWPARRAFNFTRGAADWPLVVDLEGFRARIRVAISYSNDHVLDQPYVLLGDELWVKFEPGVLRTRIYS